MKLWRTAIVLGFVSVIFVACVPPASITPLDNFKFDSPQSGAAISVNSVIVCRGTYSLPASVNLTDVHVWIVLRDNFRNYYLQNPSVDIQTEGRWETSNVRIGQGITQILAVQVTQAGHRVFVDKVNKSDFKAFVDLPDRSVGLASVDITVK